MLYVIYVVASRGKTYAGDTTWYACYSRRYPLGTDYRVVKPMQAIPRGKTAIHVLFHTTHTTWYAVVSLLKPMHVRFPAKTLVYCTVPRGIVKLSVW